MDMILDIVAVAIVVSLVGVLYCLYQLWRI